ncbi:MAG: KTSC domain-containing protein [Candidatus Dormibacteria bacterium]
MGAVAQLPTMQPVRSSHIAAIGHDQANQTLYVRFKDGATFAYSGVDPSQFDALRQAESVGSHFHRHIKGVHATKKV